VPEPTAAAWPPSAVALAAHHTQVARMLVERIPVAVSNPPIDSKNWRQDRGTHNQGPRVVARCHDGFPRQSTAAAIRRLVPRRPNLRDPPPSWSTGLRRTCG
jgi:hypothetical protein